MQEYAYALEGIMREAVKAFKTLSDESRLRILSLIAKRECCVCEVMQALQISQSKASRGLTALYDAGFLKQRKEGLWSLYSIDTETKDYLSDLLEAARKALKDNKVAAQDRERLRTAERVSASRANKAYKTALSAETF
jgi:ArsR family transcriptional regulator